MRAQSDLGLGRFIASSLLLAASIIALVSLAIPETAKAATIPAFVQKKDLLITSGRSVSVTFSNANAAGNTIVAYVVWDNSGSVSLSDSRGNAYISAIGPTKYSSDRTNAQVFYSKNVAGGTNTVTATFATAITAWGILYIHEYSGLDPVSPLDAAVAASGSQSSMNSGSLATTRVNDLLFAAGESNRSVTKVGSGYTTRSTSYGNITEDRIASATGSYNATATQNGNAWILQLAAFKAAGSSQSDTTPPVITITSPTSASTYSTTSSMLALGGTASDSGSGVSQVTWATDRGGSGTATGTTSWSVSSITLLSGTNLLTVTARDVSGNSSTDTLSVTYTPPDTTPPVITITSPTSASIYSTTSSMLALGGTASDAGSGVSQVTWATDRGGSGTATGTTSWSVSSITLLSGTNLLTVTARDVSGNSSTDSLTVTYSLTDTTPPSVPTNVQSTNITTSTVTLSWTASTDNTAVAGYRILRDGRWIATSAQTTFMDTQLTAATVYAYTVSAYDSTGNVSAASSPALSITTAAGQPLPAYPLKIGANGRYMVDQNNEPFLIIGDSPQSLIVNISEADADYYFANRQSYGFNALWINLLCADYTGGRSDGSTFDGIIPFTIPGDLSTPNEAYFSRVDRMINLAAQHGLLVFLVPAETGSWLSILRNNGISKARDYGRYLGTRYENFDNIVWMSGNDFQTWTNSADDAVVQAVALGIKDVDSRHIHTLELDYPVSGSLDDSNWASMIQLNASYTYYPTYAQVLTDYNRSNFLPVFMVEAHYELENLWSDLGTPEVLRRQEYWTLCSGAAGQFYGSYWTWRLVPGWQNNLSTTGANQLVFVKALFESRPWYNLIPDQYHAMVTSGYGTYSSTGTVSGDDYLTAAYTPDGFLIIAYMPTIRTISVDMSKLAGPALARWYDPTTGAYSTIPGSPFANSGTSQFRPSGVNSEGSGDWVLVLEAISVTPDTQGPSVPTELTATGVNSTQITFSWKASSDNTFVSGYQVYRDATLIATTSSTSYTDGGLLPLTSYSYSVAAFDYSNNVSAQSTAIVIATTAPTPAVPAFVQQKYATPQSAQSSVAALYSGAQTAGNTNILAIGWNDITSSIASVTDSSGNVYQAAIGIYRGNGLSQAIYYASNIKAATAGSNQVTVTFNQAAAYIDLRITEYSGLSQQNPFDAGASATGNSSTANSGSLVATTPSDLLFAAGITSTVFTGSGTGFTTRIITSPDGDLVEDSIAISAGSYYATASLSSGKWILQLAAFKATGQ
jgi:chitodextrinase